MDRKKLIGSLSTTLFVVIVLIGLAYALLRFKINGEKTQVLRIGDLELKLDETGNTLGLESGEILTDEEGLELNGFDFTLKNDSTKTVDYTIYLDDVELDSPTDVRLDDKYLKYSLDKNGVKGEVKALTSTGVNPERILEEGNIGKNQQNDYTLRLWVTSDVEGDITDQVFKAKIRVENTLKPNDINIDNNNIVLDINKKKQEQININKEELGEVTYQSKDPLIADVSPEGLITAVGLGSTEIDVLSGSYKDVIQVKVQKTVEATYVKQGLGVQEIEKEKDSCVLKTKEEVCEKKLPTITMKSKDYTAVGWNILKDSIEGQNGKIMFQDNVVYYAISYKNEVPYKVLFNGNGNVIDGEEKGCILPKAYNDIPQQESCNVITPTISINEKTPIIVGYNQEKTATTAEVGSGQELVVNKDNNGKTYYAITKNDPVDYRVEFDANNNQIDATEKTCTIKETYNGESQKTSCTVVTPTISVNPNTPTIIGFSQNQQGTEKEVDHKSELEVNAINNGKTYYAITRKDAVNRTVNYSKQGTGVTAIGKESDKCEIPAVYNGAIQETSCMVDAPGITVSEGYTIVGWNENKEETTGIAVGAKITLSSATAPTYYSISYKNAVTYKVSFNGNGNVIDATEKTCILPVAYNTTTQATSCNIETPTISVNAKTPTIIGYSTKTDDHTKTVGSKATLAVDSKNNGTTYYAQTTKEKVDYTVKFDANNNVIDDTSKSCSLPATFNGVEQTTTCTVITPTISVNTKTPTIIGYNQGKDTHTSEVGSKQELIVSAANHNKTYYAQTTAPAKTHTITFNKNGAQSQTDSNNVAQTGDMVTRSCTREATFNGVEQAATCSVTSPTIVGTSITPTVIGYSNAAATHSNGWAHNSKKDISGDATWYAQTTRGEVIRSITFYRNNNTSFTYGTDKVTTDSKKYTLCSIAAIYNNNNGKAQDTSCSATITMPTIEAPTYTTTVRGWTTGASTYTNALGAGSSQTLSASGDLSYYAQTYKAAITRSITFYRNSNISFTYGTEKVTADSKKYTLCTIAEVRNNNGGKAQDNSCSATITMPAIEAPTYTTTVRGWTTGASTYTNALGAGSSQTLTASGDLSYYAQTYKAAVTKNVSYQKTTGVSAIGKANDSCTIAEVRNNNGGKDQATSCTVQAPIITASSGYEVIGWNTSSSATTGVAAGTNLTLTNASTTYYAIVKSTGPTAAETLLSKYTNAASLQDFQKSTAAQQKNMYVFNHTAGAQQSNYTSAELTDYRYIGANPNNYVLFNEEMWRIIGIFTVEDANGKKEKRIKLIRDEPLNSLSDPTFISWDNKTSGTGSSSSSNGSNWWGDSRLMMVLNPGYETDSLLISGTKESLYWNRQSGKCPLGSNNGTTDCNFTSTGLTSTAQGMIGDTKWYLGGLDFSEASVSEIYQNERGKTAYGVNAINLNATSKEVKKDSIIESIAQPMINAIANTTRGISWTGKVGLMYPSDYGYATSGGSNMNRNICMTTANYEDYEMYGPYSWWIDEITDDCIRGDWLFKQEYYDEGYYEWFIAPYSGYSNRVLSLYYDGGLNDSIAYVNNVLARPVVYLTSDIKYSKGDGSSSNPFVFAK